MRDVSLALDTTARGRDIRLESRNEGLDWNGPRGERDGAIEGDRGELGPRHLQLSSWLSSQHSYSDFVFISGKRLKASRHLSVSNDGHDQRCQHAYL